jgi:hypothetical protein
MSPIFLIAALALLSGTFDQPQGARVRPESLQNQDVTFIVARVQRHVTGVAPLSSPTPASALAGHYTAETARLAALAGNGGGLEKSDLYLFRDGTYVYTEWADIEPLTIHGQGSWSFRDGIVTLAPRGTRGGPPEPGDRHYAVLTFTDGGGRTLRLMGTSCKLQDFEDVKKIWPAFDGSESDWLLVFLTSTLEAVEHYSTTEESRKALQAIRRHARPYPR